MCHRVAERAQLLLLTAHARVYQEAARPEQCNCQDASRAHVANGDTRAIHAERARGFFARALDEQDVGAPPAGHPIGSACIVQAKVHEISRSVPPNSKAVAVAPGAARILVCGAECRRRAASGRIQRCSTKQAPPRVVAWTNLGTTRSRCALLGLPVCSRANVPTDRHSHGCREPKALMSIGTMP